MGSARIVKQSIVTSDYNIGIQVTKKLSSTTETTRNASSRWFTMLQKKTHLRMNDKQSRHLVWLMLWMNSNNPQHLYLVSGSKNDDNAIGIQNNACNCALMF